MPVEKPEKSASSAEQTWFNVPDMDASFLLTDVSVAKADIVAAPAEHELPNLDAALQEIAIDTPALDAQHLEEAEMVWEQVQVPQVHQTQEAEEEIQIGNDIRIRTHTRHQASDLQAAAKTWVEALQLLDTQGALRRLGENQDLYKLLLEDFVNASYDFPQQMSIALDAEQTELATRLVHTLKGTAATIGAEQVRTLAAEIETQLRREGQADRHQCTQLYHQLEEVLNQLDEVLGLAAPEPFIDAEDDKVTDRLESGLYQSTQASVGIDLPDNPQ
ncbi:HPt (histidine-containing phosphotransfer) domain-containing protein [Allopseudospirillum japonicum]|uniref:HPt (Histidine-containing phosphotransfer) domain-containing protein n=1 Tax=Allopseudospirillum japonicum TaxID=64971 RepID=A0A1H6R6N3_9GAMM|nr:Hpt domain-containing protein [Allopseudospirillum japonicum]SEI51393.1 HPt (histidine-containing phosphotransfer) domain-containing protein [Allopseudospirillum japonicum]